jgi:hypothetical protein
MGVTDEPIRRTGLRGFLRENWIFLVAPLALILLALGALVLFGDGGPGGFFYNIF